MPQTATADANQQVKPRLTRGRSFRDEWTLITPIRKPPSRDLLGWEKEINTQIARFRWIIEQVIANFKTWRIMHTDYRRPLETFTETISAVVAVHSYALA